MFICQICCWKNCTEPLDVTQWIHLQVINGVLSDFNKIFKYKFAHLGGDEVDTSKSFLF